MSQAAQAPGAPVLLDPPSSSASSDTDETKLGLSAEKEIGGSTLYDVSAAGPLAPRREEAGSAGHGLLVIFGLKRRQHVLDLDAVRNFRSLSLYQS